MENTQIAAVFDEMADLLELEQENAFRVRAYRAAAQTIRDHSQRFADLAEAGETISGVPNIGSATAEKIMEIVETGTCSRLRELRAKVPHGVVELMRVPNLGPRKAMALYEHLGIHSLAELKAACENHRVCELPGMGEKTEEKILHGIATVATTAGRYFYRDAAAYVETLGRYLDTIPQVTQWQVAGSFRRLRESIGDLDILVEASDRAAVTKALLAFPALVSVISQGSERVSVELGSSLQVDIRFFNPESFGAALLYFTGSRAHNIAMRKRALRHKWKLNEYGLYDGDTLLAGRSEDEVFRRLQIPWIPPELREDRGEIEAAEEGRLPQLIELGDIRGDLHVHTDRTDGVESLEDMVRAARAKGYSYMAITDHSKVMAMAKGLDEESLVRHAERIRMLNASLRNFTVLAGVEVDILQAGTLDIEPEVLAQMDWVVASVHSYFSMSERAMTERLLAAIESGVVHCLGHPTGRLIGKRDPMAFDVGRVFAACAEHNVALEINAQPERMDLPDTYCQQAAQAGVKFVISTDAHKRVDFDFMPYGVAVARRGWLEKKHVLNTLTTKQLAKHSRRGSHAFR